MIVDKKYIRGFTLIEMLISMLITAMATVMMMFVYNESQKKFSNDSMELDIAVYCDRAVKEISNIVNDITTEVQQLADWDGNNCYKLTFYDIDKNGIGSDREITKKNYLLNQYYFFCYTQLTFLCFFFYKVFHHLQTLIVQIKFYIHIY